MPGAAQTSSIERIIPILSVRSVSASIRYYVAVLGFKLDWGHPEPGPYTFASVSQAGQVIMLCEGSQGGPGTWLWIGIEGNVDDLCKDYVARGAKLHMKPTNYSWAYEMRIEDPEGHVLRFGCEPKKDMPFAE